MAIHAAKLGPKNLTTKKKKKKKVKTAIFAPRLARAREQYLMALASASVRPWARGLRKERELFLDVERDQHIVAPSPTI